MVTQGTDYNKLLYLLAVWASFSLSYFTLDDVGQMLLYAPLWTIIHEIPEVVY